MWSELLVIVALVLVNGLLSGAEIAIVTVRKTRVQQLVDEGVGAARAVAELRKNPERFLATVQIGITVVGATASVYGGDTIAERVDPLLAPLPVVGPYAHAIAFTVVVVSVSYLSLVLGELVPKSLALRATERYALWVARPLAALAVAMRPIVWFLTKSSNVILKLFRDRTSFTEARMSPDELKAMLEEATEGGALDPVVGEIASRALELGELVAYDVMVPRNRIVALPLAAHRSELERVVAEHGHSRVPLFDGTVDNVTGYVSVRDAYVRLAPTEATLASIQRPVVYIPEQMRAADVLHELQSRSTHLAIVVDEHGGTAGLLTREDLVEEIVGEMLSEHTKNKDAEPRRQPDGSIVVAGVTSVREANRALGLALPEDDEWTTVAGMCLALAGRIPARGDKIEIDDGPVLEILDASPRRVRAVRIVPRSVRPSEPAA